MPLYDILNEFQKGHSHMAIVIKHCNKMNGKPDDKPGDGMYLCVCYSRISLFGFSDSGFDGMILIEVLSQIRFPERC